MENVWTFEDIWTLFLKCSEMSSESFGSAPWPGTYHRVLKIPFRSALLMSFSQHRFCSDEIASKVARKPDFAEIH